MQLKHIIHFDKSKASGLVLQHFLQVKRYLFLLVQSMEYTLATDSAVILKIETQEF